MAGSCVLGQPLLLLQAVEAGGSRWSELEHSNAATTIKVHEMLLSL